MKMLYKRFIIPLLLVFSISSAVIYSTVDIHTLTNLTAFQPWSIALALFCVGIGLTLDGTRLMHLVKISGERITLGQAVQVVFGNYFLALLTPGATGGAVAQLMFLRHAGVPAGKATVLVIVRTLVSILFLICCMPFIFFNDTRILSGVDNHTLMLISVIAFVIIALIGFAFRVNTFDYIVLHLAKRLRIKRGKRLLAFYRDLKTGVHLLASSPKSMMRIFFESGLSLMFLYAIVPCLLLGLGVTEVNWYTIMGRMIFLNMLLYFTPTPGGAGIAEGGFILLFADSVPAGTVGILAVCWRLIAEYIPYFIGLYYTLKVFGKNFLHRSIEHTED